MNYQELLDNQQQFFKAHHTRPVQTRIEQLKRLKALLQSNEAELYSSINKDFSKSEMDCYTTELSIVYADIDYYIKHIPKLARAKKVRTNLLNMPGKSMIVPEPLGTCLVIGAWNYPYQLSLCPAIAAIAAGNTVILKPSEIAANTSATMANIINNHFDPNYFCVCEGGIPETSALLELRFDKIFFTGSTHVGRIVYQAAAKHLTPVTLELGGKSPAIVSKDANIDIAAKRIIWGKFLNAGQTCVAPDYVLVEKSIKAELIDGFKKYINAFQYKPDSPHYTKIVNAKNFARLTGLIDPKKVIIGGQHNAAQRYIEPTLMDNVSWEDKVMQEEIFGPILPILTFNDFKAQLDIIQQGEKPLAAYLFSNNSTEQEYFKHKLPFGGACINDVVVHLINHHLPFGGIGQSGIGAYHGKHGFDCFSHQKSVIKRAIWGEPSLKFPPYTEKKFKQIKAIFKWL